MARKKLEELMETMKTRDTSRDAEIELIREESGRREEEFMETVKTNELNEIEKLRNFWSEAKEMQR